MIGMDELVGLYFSAAKETIALRNEGTYSHLSFDSHSTSIIISVEQYTHQTLTFFF